MYDRFIYRDSDRITGRAETPTRACRDMCSDLYDYHTFTCTYRPPLYTHTRARTHARARGDLQMQYGTTVRIKRERTRWRWLEELSWITIVVLPPCRISALILKYKRVWLDLTRRPLVFYSWGIEAEGDAKTFLPHDPPWTFTPTLPPHSLSLEGCMYGQDVREDTANESKKGSRRGPGIFLFFHSFFFLSRLTRVWNARRVTTSHHRSCVSVGENAHRENTRAPTLPRIDRWIDPQAVLHEVDDT